MLKVRLLKKTSKTTVRNLAKLYSCRTLIVTCSLNCISLINTVANPIFINLNTPRYIILYIVCKSECACKYLCRTFIVISLNTVVYMDVKLVNTFINLSCAIEIKINIGWNNTLLWIQCESNCFLVSEQEAYWITFLSDRFRLGIILSCILWDRYLRIQTESYPDWYWLWYSYEPWVSDWVASCKPDTW